MLNKSGFPDPEVEAGFSAPCERYDPREVLALSDPFLTRDDPDSEIDCVHWLDYGTGADIDASALFGDPADFERTPEENS